MPRTIGKDVTRVKRGQRGQWLGIPEDMDIDGETVNCFCFPDEETLHIALIPKAFRDDIFRALGANWSWSRNLARRLLEDAVFLRPKPMIWHHGVVTLATLAKGKQSALVDTLVEIHSPKRHSQENPLYAPRK